MERKLVFYLEIHLDDWLGVLRVSEWDPLKEIYLDFLLG